MSLESSENDLLQRAVDGDQAAFQQLLVLYYDWLVADISPRLPATMRGAVSADDVLQETFVVAFREIAKFQPQGLPAFQKWLLTIAHHRLLDMVKAHRAAKRGGGRAPLETPSNARDTSLVSLLEMIKVNDRTPSRSIARREAVAAIQVALASLKEDYREALRQRYVEGLPVAEVAARMNRTERAVHMLCHRGLQQLRLALGHSSQFFSRR